MREAQLERKLCQQVKAIGGRALKFVSPGTAGVPDRIILLPGGVVCFAELKKPGGRIRVLQTYRIKQLRELGFRVFIVDSPEAIHAFIDFLKEGLTDHG